jgi:CheY-like chemotaxis protein
METSKGKVLIVENDVAFQARELEGVLLADGYDVVGIAETGHEAVDMAVRLHPAVVLMDLELNDGKMAGAEAARRIQQQVGSQVIFITGIVSKNDTSLWHEILRTPDHQFMTKPPDPNHLLTLVSRAMVKATATKSVFLCYSRKDGRYGDEWQEHMSPYREVGIHTWADIPQIPLGGQWRELLAQNLNNAVAAVCLISIRFINSIFIRDVEWPVLRQAGLEQGLPVVPVFVGTVGHDTLERWGILKFQSINHPDDPISLWTAERRARDCWVPLCKRLRKQMR